MKNFENKPLLYIAGPIAPFEKNRTLHTYEQNIEAALEITKKLRLLEYPCICPHAESKDMSKILSHEEWMSHDYQLLKCCDILILCENFEYSKGTTLERNFAARNNIPAVTYEYFIKYKKNILDRNLNPDKLYE